MELSKSPLTNTKVYTPQQRIAKQINDHFYYLDNPSPDRMVVPRDSIYHEDDDPRLFNATIVYETHYVSKRTHVVHVQFIVDRDFKVQKETIQYV